MGKSIRSKVKKKFRTIKREGGDGQTKHVQKFKPIQDGRQSVATKRLQAIIDSTTDEFKQPRDHADEVEEKPEAAMATDDDKPKGPVAVMCRRKRLKLKMESKGQVKAMMDTQSQMTMTVQKKIKNQKRQKKAHAKGAFGHWA
jgi:hypothetical protein